MPALTISQLHNRVRTEILMDTDSSNYRWSDAVMIEFTKQTMYELMRVKPHLLIDDEGTATRSDDKLEGITLNDIATSVSPFPEAYNEALIHGIAHRCFMQDSSDAYNAQRAAVEKALFYQAAGVNTAPAQPQAAQ